MSLILQGVLVSASLVGVGIYLLQLDMAKRPEARTTQKQMRQGGVLGILFGAIVAGFTFDILLRGAQWSVLRSDCGLRRVSTRLSLRCCGNLLRRRRRNLGASATSPTLSSTIPRRWSSTSSMWMKLRWNTTATRRTSSSTPRVDSTS